MSGKLSDVLELWGFERDLHLFSDGSLGFALSVTPLDVSHWTDTRINALSEQVGQFLNGLPPHTSIQFVQSIETGSTEILDRHEALILDDALPEAKLLCQKRVEHFKQLDRAGHLPRHGLTVWVRRPMTKPLIGKPTLFTKTKAYPKISEAQLSLECDQTERLRANLLSGLESLGLRTRPLTEAQVMDAIYRQWNPSRPISRPAYDPDDVRESLLLTDAAISPEGFLLGGMHHRVLSLKLLPEQTYASMAQELRELPFDSRVLLTIDVPDQQKEIEQLQTSRRLAYSMARGKRTGVSDLDSEAKFQDLETLLSEMIAEGEKVFKVSLQIVLRSTSELELQAQVSQTLSLVRLLSGAEAMEESVASFPVFSEISIPHARSHERIKRIKTSTLSDLIPLYGPWTGTEKPSLLLRSRQGSLVSFDPFDPSLTNFNQIISGGSGSGKSFLTNIILLQSLKENPRIFIIDIGGSYMKMCEHLSGQYIALGVDSGMSLNPFDLLPGEVRPTSQKIKFLVSLVELMTKEDDSTRLPRLDRAEIEEAIEKVYDEAGASRDGGACSPRLSHLREILLAHSDATIRRYGKILSPWCGDTPFGRFIDQPSTLSLSRPIVAFDLKGMESYPDLQAVTLFMITDFLWREVQKDRTKPKFLVFDECWRLLENESGSQFIGEVFRTFRKYYASAIAISQNMDDFAKSRVATALLSNASIRWVLMQRGADQERLKEVLGLNDSELSLIASLTQKRGVYSEAFLMAGENRAVVAIESIPLEYWIATTDPRDLSQLAVLTEHHPEWSRMKTLEHLAEVFPHGVADGGHSK